MLAYEALGSGATSGRGPGERGSDAEGAPGGPGSHSDCRMAFLRTALDDPELEPGWRCGRCDLCGGLSLPTGAEAADVASAETGLRRLGVVLTPRRQWPTGMDRLGLAELTGRIGPGEQAETGLAVGRLDGLGVSAALRAMLEPTGSAVVTGGTTDGTGTLTDRLPAGGAGGAGAYIEDGAGGRSTADRPRAAARSGAGSDAGATAGVDPGPTSGPGIEPPEARAGRDGTVPRSLRSPVLEVADRLAATMTRADGHEGADAVVIVDSRVRPTLVRQFGRAVAHHLDARPLGIVAVSGPAGRHDVNSPTRLADVARSLSLDAWTAEALEALAGATVVLVDDLTDSGWTLTVAAAMLRRAGAGAIHPFVLARR